MKKTLLAFTVCAFLTACGGSDNDSSSSQPSQPSSQIGVLTDGPIWGASYTINGVTKQTNEDGEFEYQDGDEITFKIGDIEIGTVQGAARITPLELADDETTQTNLLILLQSLDKDGNHENGIELPSDLSALTSTEIDLTLPTNEFMEALESKIHSIPGLENSAVLSPDEAKENFKKSLLKDIAGIWYVQSDGGDESEIALVIKEDGSYTLGEAIFNEEDKEFNGIEMGQINTLDPITGVFTVEAPIDTNQDWGLADSGEPRNMILKFDGSQLRIQEQTNAEEGATFSRLPNNVNGIVGAWKSENSHIFIFNANNTFFLLDPVGDDQIEEGETSCGDPGIEFGNYRIDSNKLYIDPTDFLIDTNGCAGLSDTDAHLGLELNIQADTLSFTVTGEGTYTLARYK